MPVPAECDHRIAETDSPLLFAVVQLQRREVPAGDAGRQPLAVERETGSGDQTVRLDRSGNGLTEVVEVNSQVTDRGDDEPRRAERGRSGACSEAAHEVAGVLIEIPEQDLDSVETACGNVVSGPSFPLSGEAAVLPCIQRAGVEGADNGVGRHSDEMGEQILDGPGRAGRHRARQAVRVEGGHQRVNPAQSILVGRGGPPPVEPLRSKNVRHLVALGERVEKLLTRLRIRSDTGIHALCVGAGEVSGPK